MPITPTILAGIREQLEYVAKRGHAERTINAVRRATVTVCGQVFTYHNDGRRVAKAFSAVGMTASAHVCRTCTGLNNLRLKLWQPSKCLIDVLKVGVQVRHVESPLAQ